MVQAPYFCCFLVSKPFWPTLPDLYDCCPIAIPCGIQVAVENGATRGVAQFKFSPLSIARRDTHTLRRLPRLGTQYGRYALDSSVSGFISHLEVSSRT